MEYHHLVRHHHQWQGIKRKIEPQNHLKEGLKRQRADCRPLIQRFHWNFA